MCYLLLNLYTLIVSTYYVVAIDGQNNWAVCYAGVHIFGATFHYYLCEVAHLIRRERCQLLSHTLVTNVTYDSESRQPTCSESLSATTDSWLSQPSVRGCHFVDTSAASSDVAADSLKRPYRHTRAVMNADVL